MTINQRPLQPFIIPFDEPIKNYSSPNPCGEVALKSIQPKSTYLEIIESIVTNGLGYHERRYKTSSMLKRIGTIEALHSYLEYLTVSENLVNFFSKICPEGNLESALLGESF